MEFIAMDRYLSILLCLFTLASCARQEQVSFTGEELALIGGSPEVMRVLTVGQRADSLILRGNCSELTAADIRSEAFVELGSKMISTLTSPEQDGVGIAGPQVGISRRIIAVQRFDKEGEPIMVYANPRIEEVRGERIPGPEGCLSVPGCRGEVPRWQDITVSYSVLDENGDLSTVRERVEGFTAVIFQHETDHLDGIIYTDRIQ